MICNFYLSVAARKIVGADPSLRYTSLLLGRKATNQQTNKLQPVNLSSNIVGHDGPRVYAGQTDIMRDRKGQTGTQTDLQLNPTKSQ